MNYYLTKDLLYILKEDNITFFKKIFNSDRKYLKDSCLFNILIECCNLNSINIFTFLLKKEYSKNLFHYDTLPFFFNAAVKNESLYIIDLLFTYEELDVSYNNNFILISALQNNNTELLEKIITHKTFKHSFSIFKYLIDKNDIEYIKFLLKHDKFNNFRTYTYENCPISYAAINKNEILTRLFLFNDKFKYNINEQTLTNICKLNNYDLINFILDNYNFDNKYKLSLIHTASFEENTLLFKTLLKKYIENEEFNHSFLYKIINVSSINNTIIFTNYISSLNFKIMLDIFNYLEDDIKVAFCYKLDINNKIIINKLLILKNFSLKYKSLNKKYKLLKDKLPDLFDNFDTFYNSILF